MANSTFIWSGVDAKGQMQSGEIQTISLNLAKLLLKEKNIQVKEIHQQSRGFLTQLTAKRGISSSQRCLFIRQFALLIEGDINLIQALSMLQTIYQDSSLGKVIKDIKLQLTSGKSLMQAFQQHPACFNDLFCHLIRVGEQAGSLSEVLNLLANYQEKVEVFRKKITKALTYPCAVLIITLVLTGGLLLFVVPQFETIFTNFDNKLPIPTLLLLKLSHVIEQDYALILFALIGGGILMYYINWARLKYHWDKLQITLPLLGKILKAVIIARLMTTLEITLSAGLVLSEALSTVAGATGNQIFVNALHQIKNQITLGNSLTTAMAETQLFPPLVIQMLKIGENSGKLPSVLKKIAVFYEQESDQALDQLSYLLEPMVMMILGIIIGSLVIALYLPLFNMGMVK